jgi:hypothetical protein
LQASDTKTLTFTSASDLAFFTASAGRTTISPVLSESAVAGASAPNGNLRTLVATVGSGQLTVTYEFQPNVPTITKVQIFGIHHQQSLLKVVFNGVIVPSDVTNPANYTIIEANAQGSFTGPGARSFPVVLATFDAATNTATIVPSRHISIFRKYELQVNLPSYNNAKVTSVFGGPKSVGGFLDPHNHDVTVSFTNG